MATANNPQKDLLAENENLRIRLEEAEETLRAIGSGEVDAFVVSGPEGEQVFTLKGAEQPYRVLVETMNEGAATLAADGTILYCNNRLAGMLQIPMERIIGSQLGSYVAPVDRPLFMARLGMCTEECNKDEIVMITGTGVSVPVLISCCAADISSNRNISLVVTDLTQHKRNEEVIASEKLARSIIEQAGEAIVVCDEKGMVIRASRLAHQLCGENALLKHFDELFRLRLRETGCQFSVCTPLHGGCCECSEVEFKRSEEDIFHLLLNATPLKSVQNRVIGCVVTLTDFTERRKVEDALLQSEVRLHAANEKLQSQQQELQQTNLKLSDTNRRLKAQAVALAQAKEAAEKASLAKSEFLANMSHELRTPLTGVLGMLEIAIGTELSRDQREYLSLAKISSASLLSLINDLLDLAKIESGSIDLDEQEFDLRSTMEKTVRSLAVRAHQKGLEITCDMHQDLPEMVIGDPKRLSQVLNNLIGNAVKFTDSGEVAIRIWPEYAGKVDSSVARSCRLTFSIKDTGIGISEDQLQNIFERFAQADSSTTRNYGGTGLGLPISLKLVKIMEGEIDVESEVGKGSTFTFSIVLPIGKMSRSNSADYSLKGIRSLIIDDNPTNRFVLNGFLKGWEMRTTLAESGAEGIRHMERAAGDLDPYQLLLLDGHMPEMDGFEVAERIRKNPALMGLTIMMISSDDMIGHSARSRRLGVSTYLVKPVFQSRLLASIKEALAARGPGSVSPVQEDAARENHLLLSGNAWRILLAEDNEISRKAITTILEMKGWRVTGVANGLEAVEAAKNGGFDLVLMDVQMPVVDGFDATRAIRSFMPPLCDIPIIGLTARVFKEDLERCLDAGMDRHCAKPVDFKALIAEIEGLLQDRAVSSDSGRAPDELADLLEAMEGNMDAVICIIEQFLACYGDHIGRISAAVSAGNAVELQASAHQFTASLGLFCRTEPLKLTQRLTEMGEKNSLTEAPRTLELLEVEMEKLVAGLTEFAGL